MQRGKVKIRGVIIMRNGGNGSKREIVQGPGHQSAPSPLRQKGIKVQGSIQLAELLIPKNWLERPIKVPNDKIDATRTCLWCHKAITG